MVQDEPSMRSFIETREETLSAFKSSLSFSEGCEGGGSYLSFLKSKSVVLSDGDKAIDAAAAEPLENLAIREAWQRDVLLSKSAGGPPSPLPIASSSSSIAIARSDEEESECLYEMMLPKGVSIGGTGVDCPSPLQVDNFFEDDLAVEAKEECGYVPSSFSTSRPKIMGEAQEASALAISDDEVDDVGDDGEEDEEDDDDDDEEEEEEEEEEAEPGDDELPFRAAQIMAASAALLSSEAVFDVANTRSYTEVESF